MDDIYDLAQQYGLVQPDPGTDYAQDIGPSASAPQPSSGFSPVTGNLTDEDILAHFVTPQADEGLVTSPSQVPETAPTSLASEVQNPTKVKVGSSVATKGYSDTQNQRVARGPGARLDQKVAGLEARGVEEQNEQYQFAGEAAHNEKVAVAGEADANADIIRAQGRYKALESEIMRNYDTQTQSVIAEEQAKAATAKANYIAALNDFRAARVNPAQLWDNMSGGEQFGMLIAAGVQDFLAAGGIHTSAMATWNKAIDRNIDAQVRAIQTKGQVADGFKTLWDMQMAESGSVQEARTRMRGFMLDTLKTGIEGHMAQYGAALATAKGRTAMAKIDQELVKTINEVNKHQDAVTGQRITQAITRYGHELDASTAYARIAADKEIAAAKLNAQEGGPGDPYANLVFDTTESGGGKPIGEFIAGVSKEEIKDFREKQATSSYLVKLSREYQNLLLKKKTQGLLGGTRWQDTDTAQLREVAYEIINTRVKLQTGAAMNESEAKRIMTASPEALFGSQFNVRQVLAQGQKHIQDKLAIQQQSIMKPLHPDDPRRQLPNPRVIQGETEYTEAGLVQTGADLEKDIEQTIAEGRIKGLEKHNANKVAVDPPTDVVEDYKRFTSVYGDDLDPRLAHRKGKMPTADAPRQFAQALTGLARDAENYRQRAEELGVRAEKTGDKQAESEARYYSNLYKERVEILRHAAGPAVIGLDPGDRKAQYAIMKLQDLGESTGGTAASEAEGLEPTVR